MPRLAIALATLLIPALPAQAGQIRVPTDQPTLAAALAAAAPNDVILVQTQVPQGNVSITKPITILGDPLLRIEANTIGCISQPLVRLAGPGSGSVTITNAKFSSNFDCFDPPTPIGGSGFASLFLYEVEIPEPLSGATGLGNGVEGLKTTGIPFVALERCNIRSAQNDVDICSFSQAIQLGQVNHAAVDIGSGALLVLDSTLRGGNGGYLCSEFASNCPFGVATAGGEGASAVKAGSVYQANSTLQSGTGSIYLAWPGSAGSGTPLNCFNYGSYPAVIAGTNATLPGTIEAVGDPKPGATWLLSFTLPSGASYALFSFGPGAPIAVPGLGTAFLNPATFMSLGILSPGGGFGIKNYSIPNDTGLLGLQMVLQPLSVTQGLLRPVAAVIVPQ
ncbi:MAG: hypothetical protein FJ299_02595 [Planctomycetes bacterium]|nr:hypothetical protein [Planctomycetota bacterium]